jgi:hypothetical protein
VEGMSRNGGVMVFTKGSRVQMSDNKAGLTIFDTLNSDHEIADEFLELFEAQQGYQVFKVKGTSTFITRQT